MLDPKDIEAYLNNLNDLAREAGGAYYVRRERKGDCNMTDEILKHLDKAKRCGEFITPPNVCVPYLEALIVAVKDLDYIKRSNADNCTFAWRSLNEIASLLGVKEGGEVKVKETERGFAYIEFEDSYKNKCSLQKSSSIVDSIWLGMDAFTRMHLRKKDVKKLLPHLIKFVETG